MKKIAVSILILFALSLFSAYNVFAENKEDLKIIKKAVKKNSRYKAGTEVMWLKVLVRDTKANKDKLKVSLPISIIEILSKHSRDKDLKVDCDTCSFDLSELLAELRKLGPTALIEIHEKNELVKIWLE
jgi:hypothetical protein